METRFRVSPGAFFQTNSSGAEVLYSTILEKCELMPVKNPTVDDQEKVLEPGKEDKELFEDAPEEVKRVKLAEYDEKQVVEK